MTPGSNHNRCWGDFVEDDAYFGVVFLCAMFDLDKSDAKYHLLIESDLLDIFVFATIVRGSFTGRSGESSEQEKAEKQ